MLIWFYTSTYFHTLISRMINPGRTYFCQMIAKSKMNTSFGKATNSLKKYIKIL